MAVYAPPLLLFSAVRSFFLCLAPPPHPMSEPEASAALKVKTGILCIQYSPFAAGYVQSDLLSGLRICDKMNKSICIEFAVILSIVCVMYVER